MPFRSEEAKLVELCIDVALHGVVAPLNHQDANVFRLAAMILRPRFPTESERLWAICEHYFSLHPSELIESAQVVRNGWVTSPPRFRDMLEFRLNHLLDRSKPSHPSS